MEQVARVGQSSDLGLDHSAVHRRTFPRVERALSGRAVCVRHPPASRVKARRSRPRRGAESGIEAGSVNWRRVSGAPSRIRCIRPRTPAQFKIRNWARLSRSRGMFNGQSGGQGRVEPPSLPLSRERIPESRRSSLSCRLFADAESGRRLPSLPPRLPSQPFRFRRQAGWLSLSRRVGRKAHRQGCVQQTLIVGNERK
jgi:hypothetical protein